MGIYLGPNAASTCVSFRLTGEGCARKVYLLDYAAVAMCQEELPLDGCSGLKESGESMALLSKQESMQEARQLISHSRRV